MHISNLFFVSFLALVASTAALAQPTGSPTPTQPKVGATKDMPGPKDHVMVKSKEIKWAPAPPSIPAGAEIAVISGDPKVEGPFVMRLRLPAKYKLPNHWHPAHEHVTVIEGAIWLGHGEQWDGKGLKEIPAGGFAMMPPKHGHYAMTKKKTVIQVHAWGPWGITYFNPADDPRNKTVDAAAPPPTPPAK